MVGAVSPGTLWVRPAPKYIHLPTIYAQSIQAASSFRRNPSLPTPPYQQSMPNPVRWSRHSAPWGSRSPLCRRSATETSARQQNRNPALMTHIIQTLAQLRADLPITRTYTYFQTGTYAPVPLSTQHMMAELLRQENESFVALGGTGGAALFYQQAEAARRRLADLLSVSIQEVAWSYNTTTATRLAVQSIR